METKCDSKVLQQSQPESLTPSQDSTTPQGLMLLSELRAGAEKCHSESLIWQAERIIFFNKNSLQSFDRKVESKYGFRLHKCLMSAHSFQPGPALHSF